MKRKEVKNVHENSVIDSFKRHIDSLGSVIEITSKPEPPDAMITINGSPCWIEITDAFFSPELAESVTTYVADDKPHKPVPKEKRFCIDPDDKFGSVLESIIINKYDKDSIGKIYKQYGSGILLVGIINPFSDAKNIAKTEKKRIEDAIKSREPRFCEVYLYDVNDHIFHRLL